MCMDWNLFWTAFGAIGGVIGAFATTAAVVVALWQTKYSQKKKIKLTFSDNHMLYNQNNGQKIKFVGVRVTNTGNRKIIISVWGLHMKSNDALVVAPPEVSGLEKLAYTKLPMTLELEESVDLLWQMDRFKRFLNENKDEIEKGKPLIFFVQDSTGKRYEIKTERNACEYM